MPDIRFSADADLIAKAAAAAGVDPGRSNADTIKAIMRKLASEPEPRSRTADAGGAPKKAGTRWENTCVTYAFGRGLAWDRAPLRGKRDLLDITGSLPQGLLVGCKAVENGKWLGQRMSQAMEQGNHALANLAETKGDAIADGVVPVQLLQRPGYPVERAYAVTEYRYLLDIAKERGRTREPPFLWMTARSVSAWQAPSC